MFKVLDKPATWIEVDVDKTPEELAKIKEQYRQKLTLQGLKDSGYFDTETLRRGGGKVSPKSICMDEVSIRDNMNTVGYKY